MKYAIIPKRMKLLYGEEQEYNLDTNPRANIAETRRKDKKIYVNNRFEHFSKKEKVSPLRFDNIISLILLFSLS